MVSIRLGLQVQGEAKFCLEGTPQLLEPQPRRADALVRAGLELHHHVDVTGGVRPRDQPEDCRKADVDLRPSCCRSHTVSVES